MREKLLQIAYRLREQAKSWDQWAVDENQPQLELVGSALAEVSAAIRDVLEDDAPE